MEKSQLYPYASTPAVSPQRQGQQMSSLQSQKANMKLPVGPLANMKCHTRENMMEGNGRNQGAPRVTHYNHSTSSAMSPIEPRDGLNPIQFTEVRGNRQFFPNDPNWNSGSAVAGTTLPYPEIPELSPTDAGEILSRSLNVLAAHRVVEAEKQALLSNKRKDKPDEKVPTYEFTKESFDYVNSDGALQALHLLFSSFDPKEAEVRFRDCWPVYEKKFEGIFRRVALDWLKELIKDHSGFFRDIRLEALGGLLVNPGGERFISLMRQVCRLVMFTVASRKKALVKQQLLLPPIPVEDPEVTNRQVHILRKRSHQLAENTWRKYKKMLALDASLSLRMRKVDEFSQRLSFLDDQQIAKIQNIMNRWPETLGYPTEENLEAREQNIFGGRILEIIENADQVDFMIEKLRMHLENRVKDVYSPVSVLQNVLEDYDKIWHILELDKTNPITLNCRDIPSLVPESGNPSLNSIISKFMSSIDDILSHDYLCSPVSSDIAEDYQVIELRLNFLKVLESKIVQMKERKSRKRIRAFQSKRDIIKLHLNGYDWSELSRIHENGIKKLLDVTPIRVFDINRSSGCTPGINNFMESTLNRPADQNHSAIVKRRRMQRKLRKTGNDGRIAGNPAPNGMELSFPLLNVSKAAGQSGKCESTKLDSTPLTRQSWEIRSRVPLQLPSTGIPAPQTLISRKSISFTNDTPTSVMSNSSLLNGSKDSLSCTSASLLSTSRQTDTVEQSQREQENASINTPNSDAETSIELSTSVQERIARLLASFSPDSSNQSLPLQSDVKDQSQCFGSIANNSIDENKNHQNEEQHSGGVDAMSTTLFENTLPLNNSIVDDWEDAKGIMETSHIELFRNSDSDD